MNRLPLILFLVFLAACSKKQTITVKAVISGSGEPVNNFEYYVLESREVKGELLSETVAYGKTDFQGNGLVNLKMKQGRTYTLHGYLPEYACHINSNKFELIKKDKNSSFQFEIVPCGTLNLNIDNIGCTGENDQMKYRIKKAYSDWSPWSAPYLGCYSAPSEQSFVPMGPLKVQWKVDKTGYSYEDSAQITISPYLVNTFHLQY